MAEILRFSSEPIKTVEATPTQASELSSDIEAFEKSPQQEETLGIIDRKPNWPIEDAEDGRGYRLPSEATPTSNDIYNDQVPANIQFWRNAERGIFSRPLELPHFSKGLHERILRTFDLPDDIARPTVIFKAFIDDPKGPSSQIVHEERFSGIVPEEDRKDFGIGIGRITEYATNLAAKEFFLRNYPAIISGPYSEAADWFSYRFILGGTYTRMKAVEMTAEENGKDFKGAVFSALFQHDFDRLNELIADTEEMSGWKDLTDLAVDTGRHRLKKPDIGKWLGKLDTKRTEHPKRTKINNVVLSTLAAGVYRNPGVTEISGGPYFLFPVTTTVICLADLQLSNYGLISHPNLIPILGPAVVGAVAHSMEVPAVVVTGLLPFVAVHESIHHYSSNTDYMGLIPARLVHKETTPLKNQLEPEELED